jgi:TPP-dependent indolepyruvate ferredoxin oxidoreductase alpha subunit
MISKLVLLVILLLSAQMSLASLVVNTRKTVLVKIHKAGSKPRRNVHVSSSKHPKKSTKPPKKSTKHPKKSTKHPKKSTKAPKSILKSKKESSKSDSGATPSNIKSASSSRYVTIGFQGAVMASVIWWWI